MGLLALLPCIALPSCSDDDEMDNPSTNELTLSWEIEVNDDLLQVANIAYLLYEGKEETPELQTISAKSTGSKVTGKSPCTLGAIYQLLRYVHLQHLPLSFCFVILSPHHTLCETIQ